MNYGSRTPSNISVVHTLPDGKRKRICSIPLDHLTVFRNKMLTVERRYPQGKRMHYTCHTKNPHLAKLEATLDYLGKIVETLELCEGEVSKRVNELTRKIGSSKSDLSDTQREKKGAFRRIEKEATKRIEKENVSIDHIMSAQKKLEEWREVDESPCKLPAFEQWLKNLPEEMREEPAEKMVELLSMSPRVYKKHNIIAKEFVGVCTEIVEQFCVYTEHIVKSIMKENIPIEWIAKKPKGAQEALLLLEGVDRKKLAKILSQNKQLEMEVYERLPDLEDVVTRKFDELTKIDNDCKIFKKEQTKILRGKYGRITFPVSRELVDDIKKMDVEIDAVLREVNFQRGEFISIINSIEIAFRLRQEFYESIENQMGMIGELEKLHMKEDAFSKRYGRVKGEFEIAKRELEILSRRKETVYSLVELAQSEILRIKTQIRLKERRRRLHIENSPKSLEEKEEIEFKRKAYVAPEINDGEYNDLKEEEYAEVIYKSINKLIETIWSHKANSCKKENLKHKVAFAKQMKILAKIYIKNGGKITFRRMEDKIGKGRCRKESPMCDASDDFSMVRVAFARKKKYRFIIGFEYAKNPIIYFIGKKDESDSFLDGRKYVTGREKSKTDGRESLFPETLEPAIKAYKTIREHNRYFSLFDPKLGF